MGTPVQYAHRQRRKMISKAQEVADTASKLAEKAKKIMNITEESKLKSDVSLQSLAQTISNMSSPHASYPSANTFASPFYDSTPNSSGSNFVSDSDLTNTPSHWDRYLA